MFIRFALYLMTCMSVRLAVFLIEDMALKIELYDVNVAFLSRTYPKTLSISKMEHPRWSMP